MHKGKGSGRAGMALLLLLAVLGPRLEPVHAQSNVDLYDYTRTDLDWYTLETDHFNVVFHADSAGQGSSRTAQVVARIAEDVYGPITSLYQHEPDTKVTFVLKDFEDYSNGAAYFFDNKIDIWAPALDSPLRGDHSWLRNVITHEFTHIIQVQKTMKGNRRVPIYYLQWLHYEDVKRPDVLYGYPNGIVSYPIPILNNPAWLAEGTAQFQRNGLGYDQWDSHRDMLLRTRVLAEQEMSLADMGGFYSHTSLLREGVYNHGFAFTRYLAHTYGEDVLRKISDALSRLGRFKVEQAIQAATGKPGDQVYSEWIAALRSEYTEHTARIRTAAVEGRIVEKDGFNNMYPRFSPDGKRLAYISNRGEDYSRTGLYVRDVDSGELTVYDLPGLGGTGESYTCSMGHPLQPMVNGSFDWMPDGLSIVFTRTRDNKYGYLYDDLYEITLATKKVKRLTRDRRASAPIVSPDGKIIVYITQGDGTTNLMVMNREDGAVRPLTRYADGIQVSDPAWHPAGQYVYFARSARHGRDLYRVNLAGSEPEIVLATQADERSPAFDPRGEYLYYVSDQTGIFNLYRSTLQEGNTEVASVVAGPIAGAVLGKPELLTNVIGGAFMPAVSATGRVAFSQYQWDGYKIAVFDEARPTGIEPETIAYTSPSVLKKAEPSPGDTPLYTRLNDFDDTDLHSLRGDILRVSSEAVDLDHGSNSAGTDSAPDSEQGLTPKKYKSIFSSFSFYPVLRFDQYVSREKSRLDGTLARRSYGETVLRNTKAGLYMGSREVLDGLNFFGGVLVGPASYDAGSFGGFFAPSHLLKLERDVFVQFEYLKGFGLFPWRWSPQISVELNNITRNVDEGLSIEEFPCTSCYPDTSYADLSYNLWEADINVRSKINRALLLEVGYRYSPYRVTTERFFSREYNQSISESSSKYYIGKAFRVKAYLDLKHPYRNDDVVPEGLRAELSYEYEPGRLLDRFDVEDGMLVPNYVESKNHRLTIDSRLGFRLPGSPGNGAHGLGFRLRASTILGKPVDDFYDDYVGGLIGARGYPFYALGGNEVVWFQTSYLFPLMPNIHKQVASIYLDKIYGRIYADAASAWSGKWDGLKSVRKDVGAEIRVGLGSFYLLPTAVFASATYGFDAFDFQLDEGFVTPDGHNFVRYGNEIQWHFGILFSFDP